MSLPLHRRQLRFLVALAAACVAAVPLTMASPAAAYVTIDSRCILRTWAPIQIDGGGDQQVEGEVDCSGYGAVPTDIEDCMQVQAPGGGFATISGSCAYSTKNASYNDLKLGEAGVCNRVYRTFNWGEDISTGITNTNTSQSVGSCAGNPATVSQNRTLRRSVQSYVAAPSAITSSFPVLSQPATASDQLPNSVAPSATATQEFGLSPSASRLLVSSASGQTWLIPGSQGVCAVANSAPPTAQVLSDVQTSCDTTAAAQTQGMFSVDGSTVTAILPYGAGTLIVRSQAGASATGAPNADGVAVVTVQGQPSSVSFIDPSGQGDTVAIPTPVTPSSAP
jgi:hypothetical protein